MKVVDTYNSTLRMFNCVKLVKLGGNILEGKTGTLVGVSNYVQGMIYWIVELDETIYDETIGIWSKYITMPSVCLEIKYSW